MLSVFFFSLVAAAPVAHVAPPALYGLALVANGPAKVGLAKIDPASGAAKVLGGPHATLFGAGDLVAIAHGALYYLGDSPRGATLVSLNLTTGAEICSAVVSLKEVGYVGIGQSLDFDESSDTLVLSGIAPGANTSHAVYRAPATGCGPFTHVGTFGYADYLPMLHASALDADGQRLFVILGTGEQSSAIGMIDLKPAGKTSVVAEGVDPDYHDTLMGMHWDPHTSCLLGVVGVGSKLQLHSLNVTNGKGKWDAPRDIAAPAKWDQLGINGATGSGFSVKARSMYFIAGPSDAQGDLQPEVATVDVDHATVSSHPPLASVGMAGCKDCLEALTV
jgi:hypothetical protein